MALALNIGAVRDCVHFCWCVLAASVSQSESGRFLTRIKACRPAYIQQSCDVCRFECVAASRAVNLLTRFSLKQSVSADLLCIGIDALRINM